MADHPINSNPNQHLYPESYPPYFPTGIENQPPTQPTIHPGTPFPILKNEKNDAHQSQLLMTPIDNFTPGAYSTPIQQLPLGPSNFNGPPPFLPPFFSPCMPTFDVNCQYPVDGDIIHANYSGSSRNESSASLNASSSSSSSAGNSSDSGVSLCSSSNRYSPYPIEKPSKKMSKPKFGKPVVLAQNYDPNEKFDSAPGRLGLLGDNPPYDITVGEILRRINPPETLHVSLLNALLRKGKSKDGAEQLRKRLKGLGIDAPDKLSAKKTRFTGLCEAEALKIAEDFKGLLSVMDTKAIANQMIANTQQKDLLRIKQGLDTAFIFLREVFELYKKIGENPSSMTPPENEAEQTIQMFSLLTHGFGQNAVSGVLQHLCSILNDFSQLLTADESLAYIMNMGNFSVPQVYS
ncbi:hypothetical protein WR25_24038 [Diploscapter pachys]|uniref:Transcription factor AP-2 C-terminal domain-containing protein n=1 Tax=Diploscapter pachys TaxID=2018661 RepID=A0A2A2JUP7_9BILA|nr:hypothetical protein WR25_24038 [Diploscapter pachys]